MHRGIIHCNHIKTLEITLIFMTIYRDNSGPFCSFPKKLPRLISRRINIFVESIVNYRL